MCSPTPVDSDSDSDSDSQDPLAAMHAQQLQVYRYPATGCVHCYCGHGMTLEEERRTARDFCVKHDALGGPPPGSPDFVSRRRPNREVDLRLWDPRATGFQDLGHDALGMIFKFFVPAPPSAGADVEEEMNKLHTLAGVLPGES